MTLSAFTVLCYYHPMFTSRTLSPSQTGAIDWLHRSLLCLIPQLLVTSLTGFCLLWICLPTNFLICITRVCGDWKWVQLNWLYVNEHSINTGFVKLSLLRWGGTKYHGYWSWEINRKASWKCSQHFAIENWKEMCSFGLFSSSFGEPSRISKGHIWGRLRHISFFLFFSFKASQDEMLLELLGEKFGYRL